nr:SdiA-regulated domain-containing protein [uncultured Pedobacter sp.]
MYKLLLVLIAAFLMSCLKKLKEPKHGGPKVDSTAEIIEVPKSLKEISGISFVNDSIVAAIEDESGTLYFFDLNKKEIVRKYSFAEDGDYEDLVRKGNDMYVLRSDGVIYQIVDFVGPHPQITRYTTPLKSKNNMESLAYDAKNNRLLLAVKDRNLNKADKEEDFKCIYQFTLKDMKFHEEPVMRIYMKDIVNQFKGDALIEASKHFLKAVGNQNLNEIIRPSALTYNPKNGKLYVLSSINKLILVLNPDGSFSKVTRFTGKEFIQPEGIAFNSKGKLFVSNEGKKKKGNIIKLIE